MGGVTDRRRRWTEQGSLAVAVLVTGVTLVAGVALASAVGALPASAQSSCDSSDVPIAVHFELALGGHPGIGSAPAVLGVVLSGFPSTCEGAIVQLEMWGNRLGNPTVPQSDDTLLSTAVSSKDPCTQTPLATPSMVTSGSITLALCSKGGVAGSVSVHDLTRLDLFLTSGRGGTPTTSPRPSGGVGGVTTVIPTPSTGSGPSWPSDLLGIGIALVLVGCVAVGGAVGRSRGVSRI